MAGIDDFQIGTGKNAGSPDSIASIRNSVAMEAPLLDVNRAVGNLSCFCL